jgi:virulence factor Mce-like protein
MARLRRNKADAPRVLRKDRTGADPVKVGAIVIGLILIASYFGFTKDNPFSRGFRFDAVFPSANSIRVKSPVRIAGVNVGTVVAVKGQEGTDNAVVTMEIKDEGLPIHKDARLKIKQRIFLEGNFFVDVEPGTPSMPTISDGDTIPVAQTSDPVQVDQFLTGLQRDTREDLQKTLVELGAAFRDKPTPEQDADQPAFNRGKTAAESLNSALGNGEEALKGSAIVQDALLGEDPDDLKKLIGALARIGEELGNKDRQVGELVENFNTTMAALASEQANLSASIEELGPTVQAAYTSLGALNDSLPAVRAFSRALIPGVEQTQPTIDAVTPWIRQVTPFVSQSELGGLLDDLVPATAALAKSTSLGIPSIKEGNLFAKCMKDVFLPAGDKVLVDKDPTTGADFSSGKANYKEFWYAMAGLAGESQNFDGNGAFIRTQSGGGAYPVTMTGGNIGDNGKLFGNSLGRPLGTRPAWTTKRPAYKPDEACYKQQIPDFGATPTGPSDGVK